jgi:hypothetical protein
MNSSRLALLIISSSLLLLVLLPSTSSSPGHYVHNYYREGTYDGQKGEKGRSARHLNTRNSAQSLLSTDCLLAVFLAVTAALRQQLV